MIGRIKEKRQLNDVFASSQSEFVAVYGRRRIGCIFQRGEKGAWDASQADGWPALADTRWDGPNTLNLFNGRYWPYYGVKTP